MKRWFSSWNFELAILTAIIASGGVWWAMIGFVILEWNMLAWEPYQRAMWLGWPVMLLFAVGAAIGSDTD